MRQLVEKREKSKECEPHRFFVLALLKDPSTSQEESGVEETGIDSNEVKLTPHSVVASMPDTVPDKEHQEQSVTDGKDMDASVYDKVKSEANEHESETPSSTEDPTQKPHAEKDTKRKSSWFRRGKRSSAVKPGNIYGKYFVLLST